MTINDLINMKSFHQLIEEINVEIESKRDELLIEFNKKQNKSLNAPANNLSHKIEILLGKCHEK